MQVLEVPVPHVSSGSVLVRNRFSVVSAGTEGSTVQAARKGYIGKAKERPEQVRQVIQSIREKGVVQTYRAVMKKLDAHSPLGYSSAGEVVEVGPGVREFETGDLVACGGLTASHAELVSVPVNLCVKLRPDADLKQAAYNTLGAIAMQGVRQADLRLGETCAVIGLGLLGQLTGVLLRASGVRVIGIDISEAVVEIARERCADLALTRDTAGVESRIMDFTRGIGCDAVIITAASDSLDPVNFAGAITRKKGTVVVVGAVPTGFDREPHYYKKELSLKMSCSYGPGRYDLSYEEKGLDYPAAYVRWTEKRNMDAFQELLASRRIDISYLTTHTFKLAEAPAAYDMMLSRSEPYIGILIEYDTSKEISKDRISLQRSEVGGQRSEGGKRKAERVAIGFIGAGSYAQSYLLPNIPKGNGVLLKGVMTGSSTGSRSVADRFGFQYCTGNAGDILSDPEIDTVFIASRHDTHGKYVLDGLKAGKHVFVEKPLCLTSEELGQIVEVCNSSLVARHSSLLLMVGYNRRFSPLAQMLKEKMGSGPLATVYRVNAGAIPADNWIQDPELGGGRIIGEVCHFIDFLTFMSGSLPVSIQAAAMDDPEHMNDTLSLSLKYENGSIGTILYFANGSKSLAKEYVEVYGHGLTGVLKDFRELQIHGRGKPFAKKLLGQDKGQKNEVRLFLDSIRNGKSPLIPLEEILSTSEAAFRALESVTLGAAPQHIAKPSLSKE
jgi:predicted dehydrogenase/threonine dehydrogenase-like Zn-dependent dehydrogenase